MSAYDVAVVGGGLMGAATAWAAARRGLHVVLFEQHQPAHAGGSSSGSARIVRRAYPDPFWVRLTGEAFELWRELEQTTGTSLLRLVGGLDHGGGRDPDTLAQTLRGAGVPCELLPADEAATRWPGLVFDGPVLHHAQAGTVDAEGAVAAFLTGAAAHGAQVVTGAAVTRIHADAGGAELTTPLGPVTARRVVAAAGAWMPDLLRGLVPLPPLTVYQQQVFHFERTTLAADTPVVIHKGERGVYHLPGGRSGGPGDARKVAEHDWSVPTSATTRDGVVLDAARERTVDYVRRWLPGLNPQPSSETTCLYTNTANEDFVIDRQGSVVVCSPCSGHGAKFAPLVGELAADLATGVPPREERFTLAAHLAGAAAR
ncbi:sarcosine oxidase [Motilibacter peucedani]|uniref:Sarcosine oxidase n=1 Tax=Motilibacter peucedani TaxID=598650 RepID=A0A420XUT2_9ACTN|nr:FAD-dependent oxidoreductase [Motilibacter peucedani]RKS80500.1 sarcosine oxidase [Motilibacter peucedani]